MTDPDRDKWEDSDLSMAREQAFQIGDEETMSNGDILIHARKFQSLTEGCNLDLTDPDVVTALTYAANVIAGEENRD